MDPGSKGRNERRLAPRVAPARITVEIDGQCGIGLIHDLSSTGIRIENSDVQPPVQAHARLRFVFGRETFDLGAILVRHTLLAIAGK
jgi:hypothetical protein